MVHEIAPAVLAADFVHHPTDDAYLNPAHARREDCRDGRRLVQSGSAEPHELVTCARALTAA